MESSAPDLRFTLSEFEQAGLLFHTETSAQEACGHDTPSPHDPFDHVSGSQAIAQCDGDPGLALEDSTVHDWDSVIDWNAVPSTSELNNAFNLTDHVPDQAQQDGEKLASTAETSSKKQANRDYQRRFRQRQRVLALCSGLHCSQSKLTALCAVCNCPCCCSKVAWPAWTALKVRLVCFSGTCSRCREAACWHFGPTSTAAAPEARARTQIAAS